MSDIDFREHTQGEFRGDFTRDTFYPLRHLTRVFMQQGRVQLDADWNEQVSILLHYLRSAARDLGGEHWGPSADAGFRIGFDGKNNLTITKGHYYVQGILCENEEDLIYTEHPDDAPKSAEQPLPKERYLVYLDVWERHLTYIEDELIREVALGGPDTATRAKIVWQVKMRAVGVGESADAVLKTDYQAFLRLIANERKPGSGTLRARARRQKDNDEPCLTTPDARYRGAENQLYRVEIHKGGKVGEATFKWSRDNGSVTFPIRTFIGKEATLEHLGRDKRLGLKKNDWVEIVDDHIVLRGEAGRVAQVDKIDMTELTVTLKVSEGAGLPDYQENDTRHPLLRRWDQQSDAIPVSEGDSAQDNDWINLESGVQILFPKVGGNQASQYRIGDYWLIPARTATGDVEWPGPVGSPTALPPHGIIHHYAPLAIISVANGTISSLTDLRRTLKQLWG